MCKDFARANKGFLAAKKVGDACGRGQDDHCFCFAVRSETAHAEGKINLLRVLSRTAPDFAKKVRVILDPASGWSGHADLPDGVSAMAPCNELRAQLQRVDNNLVPVFGDNCGEGGGGGPDLRRCVCVALQEAQQGDLSIARVRLPQWHDGLPAANLPRGRADTVIMRGSSHGSVDSAHTVMNFT
jgi:hypothetical protein